MNLTKSDFKIARTCPTKLYYKKLGYPSGADENPYLQFLADGGYMVETMAKLLFPGGKELGNWSEPARAHEEVADVLEAGNGVFFEATVVNDGLLARIDILVREGSTLKVIEVKSSAIDSIEDGPSPFRGKKGAISSEWRPYLEDVAFQALVLKRAFPQFHVIPFLCVVDKARSATPNSTFDKFRLDRTTGGNTWRPSVEYLGVVTELQRENLIAVIDVSSEVQELEPEVEKAAAFFVASLQADPINRIPPELGKHCKGCEYRMPVEKGAKSGFRECWGALAEAEPHVLDLYRLDLLGGRGRDVVAEMAANGQSQFGEISQGFISGAVAIRQRLQIERTAANDEYINPELKTLLLGHRYPLHFIDFEASRLAIPYHVGMRPYELAAFQWSCHTIESPGAEVKHTEWLNDRDAFPNSDFALALRDRIGDEGTVYIWSPYELAVLREIRVQMQKYEYKNDALGEWIDRLTAESNPRVIDLCALAKDHYFHPAMKGSLSIKYVLPAVWGANEALREMPMFREYLGRDGDGKLLNPYFMLPALPIGAEEEAVREGTGAMRVYQEMMFGRTSLDPVAKDNCRKLLLQYCKLDTAAMVAIWRHWAEQISAP